VNGNAKEAIIRWFRAQQTKFNPTFVRVSKAEKDLSETQYTQPLGLDTTLPQNRVGSANTNFSQEQNQYPVSYFFCDTLTEDRLSILEPASVSGGILRTWPGKYQALVDKRPNA
jgi:hypothetical protein